jgi:hypothetical protein
MNYTKKTGKENFVHNQVNQFPGGGGGQLATHRHSITGVVKMITDLQLLKILIKLQNLIKLSYSSSFSHLPPH